MKSQAMMDYKTDDIPPRPMTEEPTVYFAGAPDSLEWHEAMLRSYENSLANLEKLVPQSDSLDRIRASFQARIDELKEQIAEMKK